MFQAVYLNLSMNFLTLFIFFQLYFRYRDSIASDTARNVFLGVGFGVAQYLFRSFPIFVDGISEPIFIGGTIFITAGVFGGGIAAFIALFSPEFVELLFHGFPNKSILAYWPQAAIVCIISISFSMLRWARWKTWLLLNTAFHCHLFVMEPNISIHFALFRFALEVLCGAIIYYLVHYMLQTHEFKKTLERHVITDGLTGLYNVRYFKDTFHKKFIQAQKEKHDLAIILLDIDFFKKINDTYGHAAGDQVLIQLAAIMKDTFRDYGIASRNGGEEFSVIFPKMSKEMVIGPVMRFREKVEQHAFVLDSPNSPLRVTISVGLAFYSDNYTSPEQLLASADMALYRAKQNGRNLVCSS
jgi:diguanylate cyclase